LIEEFDCLACGRGVPLSAPGNAACPGCSRVYERKNGVTVLEEAGRPADFPESAYAIIDAAEKRHFWFTARRRTLLSALREMNARTEGGSAFDIGCGTGSVLSTLESAGLRAVGIDMHLDGLRYARGRTGAILFQGAVTNLPFTGRFDVATCCDVIEHADDDRAILSQAAKILKPDGVLIVTVPADPDLWSPFDDASGHKRRYTRETLDAALRDAGLRPVFIRPFNVVSRPLVAWHRRWMKRRSARVPDALSALREGLRPPPAGLNILLKAAIPLDMALSRRAFFPGTSLTAAARLAR
jgi:SAM-dependent methyltransferase